MTKNKLKLNPSKTEFLVLGSSRNQQKITSNSLQLSEGMISRSDSARNLGVIMDSKLDMHMHVSNVRKLYYFYPSWIRDIRHVLSETDAKVLVHTLVKSRLDYCNGLNYGLPKY